MSDRVLVSLNHKIAPGDKDWIRGTLQRHDSMGIRLIPDRYGMYDPNPIFFPAHEIQRIEYE